MAGGALYTALLDANVLYPALLRDVLLSLAHADLYSAKWSAHIRAESGHAACYATDRAWRHGSWRRRRPWRMQFPMVWSPDTNT